MVRLAELKAASANSRGDLVVKAGWATMPGATVADAQVAKACASQLASWIRGLCGYEFGS